MGRKRNRHVTYITLSARRLRNFRGWKLNDSGWLAGCEEAQRVEELQLLRRQLQ